MTDQSREAVPYFVQVCGEPIPNAALSEYMQVRARPAAALPFAIVTGQCPHDALGAAGGSVVFARRQFLAAMSRVETQIPAFRFETGDLLLALWVKAADDPGLPLHYGQADDDHSSTSVVASGLLQSVSPLWLVILITH